jgi:hypothetical protein
MSFSKKKNFKGKKIELGSRDILKSEILPTTKLYQPHYFCQLKNDLIFIVFFF